MPVMLDHLIGIRRQATADRICPPVRCRLRPLPQRGSVLVMLVASCRGILRAIRKTRGLGFDIGDQVCGIDL
jgi:hypothetical protein